MDIRDDEIARIAQRRHATPIWIVVANANRRMRFIAFRRIVDQTIENDMIDFVTACIQETYDLATASRIARYIANLDVCDVVVIRRHHAADHCMAVQSTLQCTFADGRQRNQIIARVSRNRLNDNIMATLPQVDSVLVQHRYRLVANDFFRCRFEIQMGQQAIHAMLE